jgi:hypothetical protein
MTDLASTPQFLSICSHQQMNQEEYENYGLIFRKFERVQDRKKEEEIKQSEQKVECLKCAKILKVHLCPLRV